MEEKVLCPVCGKRVFDLIWREATTVNTKCRHCDKIISVTRDAPEDKVRKDPDQLTLYLN